MKFSIIIPLYNAADTISRTLDSLLKQTYKNYEIILINDGSKDTTESICVDFQKKNAAVKYFSIENSGPGIARNHGLKNANGDYVCFVDADDYVTNSMLEDYNTILNSHPVDILFNGHIEINRVHNKENKKVLLPEDEGLFNQEHFRNEFSKFEKVNIHALWNKVYSNKILEAHSIRFPSTRFGEDAVFNFQAFRHVENVFLNRKAYYYYDKTTEASIVKSYSDNRFLEDNFMAQQYKEMYEAWGLSQLYATNISLKYWAVLLNSLRNINQKDANITLMAKNKVMKSIVFKPDIQQMFNSLSIKQIPTFFQKTLWILLKKKQMYPANFLMKFYLKIRG